MQQYNETTCGMTDLFFSNRLTIVQESPKPAAVQVIQDCDQQLFVEFKGCRKLITEKAENVNKLMKAFRSPNTFKQNLR